MPQDEHPFGRITRQADYYDRMLARGQASFEEGKVRFLLTSFKLNAAKLMPKLRAAEERETGVRHPTLRAFNAMFPSFPLLLSASRLDGAALHTDPKATLPALFKAFGAAPFVTAYERWYEQAGERTDGRTVALVFPRNGLKNGMVVYAADAPDAVPLGERETLLCYAGGDKKHRKWLVVRSFKAAVEAIHNRGHGWRPADDL